jgi:hypothetical protein
MRRIATLALAASAVFVACSPVANPTSPPISASPTPEEAHLLAGIRLDVQGTCAPLRADLPDGTLAAIACRPVSDVVLRAAVYLYNTQDALMAAYLARLAMLDVRPRSNGGSCEPGRASEGAYTPGDEGPDLSPTRGACYLDDAGDADYLATLPPFVMIEIDGLVPDPEAAQHFAWLGNQDVPGSPTLWSRNGPLRPEK